MSSSAEPIIAGSRGFALALLAPLTEKVGTRPRIAADAVAAGAFCAAGGGLVVVEYLGADTLRGVEALLAGSKGVRVVVAVPEKHAAADAPLLALGAEVARWNGAADAILAMLGRPKAAPVPRASQPAVPVSPAPEPAAATPPPSAPVSATPRPAPAAVAPAMRPPSAPAAAPPAPSAGSRAPAPQAPPRKPTPQPHPATPAAAVKPPAPPRLDAPLPVTGSARPTPPAVPAVAAPSVPPVTPSRAPPQRPAAAAAAVAAKPPAAPRGPTWPSAVPGQADAAAALQRAFAGGPVVGVEPGLADVLTNVHANLTDLERSVLAEEPQAVDPRPIRDAAVMRVRVGFALATVPAPGGEVDSAAVSALLAEMDALLSQVSAVAADAPPDALPSLEAVRNALVREAIDFSEAVQRASPAGEAPAPAAPPRATARVAQARLLSMDAVPERRSGRQRAAWIALGAVLLATAGYHGWGWYERRAARAALRKPGVPVGLIELPAVPGTPRMFVPERSDEPVDAAELARFRAAEEAKGNVVREENGFVYVTQPRRVGAAAPGAPGTAAPTGPPPPTAAPAPRGPEPALTQEKP